MFPIVEKVVLAPAIYMMKIAAAEIAAKAAAGQFFILRQHEKGERIPLTIADYDRDAGTVTVVFRAVGKSTEALAALEEGQALLNVAGPLGRPFTIRHYGHVICVGGGVGAALLFPVARSLQQAGNRVTCLAGARNASLLLFLEQLKTVSDRLCLATEDGSAGSKGTVTDLFVQVLKTGQKADLVFAVGPAPMMSNVAGITRPSGIKTVVSLNPIMVDGTGICGACRVEVGGTTKFACIDGPDFDAHQVDFGLLLQRQQMYASEEQTAREKGRRRGSGCHDS